MTLLTSEQMQEMMKQFKPKTLLDWALEAVRRGWYVFPCWPRSKSPATEHGFKDSSNDEAQIRAWWAENPNYNPAIDLGRSNLVVVDFDTAKPLGTEPPTYTVKTGRIPKDGVDGIQMYYTGSCKTRNMYRDANGNSTLNDKDKKVGEVRSRGAYVMAAGCIHPSGNPYIVINDVPLAVSIEQNEVAPIKVKDAIGTDEQNEIAEYVEGAFDEAGIDYTTRKNYKDIEGNGFIWNIVCPWKELHSGGEDFDTSSVVIMYSSGMLIYECKHRCLNIRQWKELRAWMEQKVGHRLVFGPLAEVALTQKHSSETVESVTDIPASTPSLEPKPETSAPSSLPPEMHGDNVLVFETIDEAMLAGKLGFYAALSSNNPEDLRTHYGHVVLFGNSEASNKLRTALDKDAPCTSCGMFPPNLMVEPHAGFSGRLIYPPCKNLIESRQQFETDDDLKAYLTDMLKRDFVTSYSTKTSKSETVYKTYADVEMQYQHWLWQGRIPLGALIVVCGNPDAGKNIFISDFIARVSRGYDMPDNTPNTFGPSRVILAEAEDSDAMTTAPRLAVAAEDCCLFSDDFGADLKQVLPMPDFQPPDENKTINGKKVKISFKKRQLQLSHDLERLERMVKDNPGVRLVVISPISAHMGPNVNTIDESQVRAVLQPVNTLAAKLNVSIIAIMHLNKTAERETIYRVSGAMGFVGVSRAVWLIARDQKDGKRYFVPVKGNLAETQKGMSFEIKDAQHTVPVKDSLTGKVKDIHPPRIYWGGRTDRIADDILKPLSNKPLSDVPAAKVWWQGLFDKLPKEKNRLLDLETQRKARSQVMWSDYAIEKAAKLMGVFYKRKLQAYVQLNEFKVRSFDDTIGDDPEPDGDEG